MGHTALEKGEPVGVQPLVDEKGKTTKETTASINITCHCDWSGPLSEMLVIDDDMSFYCPMCGSPGWTYD